MNDYINVRVTSTLDLSMLIELALGKLASVCKRPVYVAAKKQLERLQLARMAAYLELESLKRRASGIFGWLSTRKAIKALQAKLAELSEQLLSWAKTCYEHAAVR